MPGRKAAIKDLHDAALLSDAQATALQADASEKLHAITGLAVTDAAVVTTVGANTGTAGAGLSLIGDTSTTNQAANLMNDLVALQEDILNIRTQLNALLTQLRISEAIAP